MNVSLESLDGQYLSRAPNAIGLVLIAGRALQPWTILGDNLFPHDLVMSGDLTNYLLKFEIGSPQAT